MENKEPKKITEHLKTKKNGKLIKEMNGKLRNGKSNEKLKKN